jgi:UDP:flavonoid glycosyltransferase YjiC (YdhE family)
MRVLFSSTSGEGHFQPLIPLIRAFEASGHETLTVAPSTLARTLEAEAVAHRLGEAPSAEDSDRVWTHFPTLARRDASLLVEREWFARLCLAALMPTVESAVDEWSPDLMIRETCEYASAVIAHRSGIRHAQVAISTAEAESSVLRELVRPELDGFADGLTQQIFESPYLTKFPASLDPSPYPTTLRFRNHEIGNAKPLGNWWPSNAAPLVYLTFGTTATGLESGRELLRLVLATIQELDIRILVTTGSKMSPADLGEVPGNVHVESWIHQDDVLAEAAIVICHGGSGTTFGALGAGVPLIFLPLFADQPTNARMIHDAGAGIAITEGGESTAMNFEDIEARLNLIRVAVEEMLTNSSYRDSARALAEEIARADSPTQLVNRLAMNP